MSNIFNLFINLDKNIIFIVQQYGLLIYPFLFLIIFCETGLVIFPFLPGDTLLFAAGTIASQGYINLYLIFILAIFAAILGDSLNYFIGKTFGRKIVPRRYNSYLIQTEKFYEKHGGKTIILARFIPLIRTFAPFVAGLGKMKYSRFIFFNIIGGVLWVVSLTSLGFFFGNLPFIKNNFGLMIILIILISYLPIFISYLIKKLKR